MAEVFIPASLRQQTQGTRSMTIEAATVRDVVEALDARFPGIKNRLCADDRLKPGISVAIDSRVCEKGLLEPVSPDSEVHFVPSVSGG